MKKSIGLIASLALCATVLTGCAGQSVEDLTLIRSDKPTAAVKAELGITELSTDDTLRNKVYSDDSTGYSLYVAKNLNESLFKTEADITSFLKDHYGKTTTYTANPFFFHTPGTREGIYTEEMTAITKAAHQDGSVEKLTYPYSITSTTESSTLVNTLSTKAAVSYYQYLATEAVKGTDTQAKDANVTAKFKVETLYAPVFVQRYYKDQTILYAYMFLPIYQEIIVNGKAVVVSENADTKYQLVDSKLVSVRKASPDVISTNYVNDGNPKSSSISSTK